MAKKGKKNKKVSDSDRAEALARAQQNMELRRGGPPSAGPSAGPPEVVLKGVARATPKELQSVLLYLFQLGGRRAVLEFLAADDKKSMTTPLYDIVAQGNMAVLKFLVKNDLLVARDANSRTILHHAVAIPAPAVLSFLKDYPESLVHMYCIDTSGRTPLQYAVWSKEAEEMSNPGDKMRTTTNEEYDKTFDMVLEISNKCGYAKHYQAVIAGLKDQTSDAAESAATSTAASAAAPPEYKSEFDIVSSDAMTSKSLAEQVLVHGTPHMFEVMLGLSFASLFSPASTAARKGAPQILIDILAAFPTNLLYKLSSVVNANTDAVAAVAGASTDVSNDVETAVARGVDHGVSMTFTSQLSAFGRSVLAKIRTMANLVTKRNSLARGLNRVKIIKSLILSRFFEAVHAVVDERWPLDGFDENGSCRKFAEKCLSEVEFVLTDGTPALAADADEEAVAQHARAAKMRLEMRAMMSHRFARDNQTVEFVKQGFQSIVDRVLYEPDPADYVWPDQAGQAEQTEQSESTTHESTAPTTDTSTAPSTALSTQHNVTERPVEVA